MINKGTRRIDAMRQPPCYSPAPGMDGDRCHNFEKCKTLFLACSLYSSYCGLVGHGRKHKSKGNRLPLRSIYHRIQRTAA